MSTSRPVSPAYLYQLLVINAWKADYQLETSPLFPTMLLSSLVAGFFLAKTPDGRLMEFICTNEIMSYGAPTPRNICLV